MLVGSGRADALADAEKVKVEEDARLDISPIGLATVRDKAVAAAVTTSATGDASCVKLAVALIHAE